MKKIMKQSVVLVYYYLLSISVTFFYQLLITSATEQSASFFPLATIFTLIFFTLLWKNIYSYSFHYYLHKIKKTLIYSGLAAISLTMSLYFVMNLINNKGFLSRLDVVHCFGYFGVLIVTFVIAHIGQFYWIRHLGNLGYFTKKVLVIGNECETFCKDHHFDDIWHCREYAGNLRFNKGWEYNNLPLSKNPAAIEELIYTRNIGGVLIFLDPYHTREKLDPIIAFLSDNAIPYKIFRKGAKLPKLKWGKEYVIHPTIEQKSYSKDSIRYITLKRLLSIFIALYGIIAGLPIWIGIGLAIKLYDKGPVFYISDRVGKNGRHFKFFKFRTMRVDAEKMKAELMKYNERSDGPLFKMKDDPRITPIGKILRKFSIDEFPQLINILKGDMSFIGPRPHLPSEVEHYAPRDYLRLECIPGISGLPQINDRNNISFRDWIELDLKYRKKWSIFLDFSIFFRTIGVALEPLFKKDGGY